MPWSPNGGPKSIRMARGTPLGHTARLGRKRDLDRNSKDLPFWTFLAAPGRSKDAFWTPGGSQKGAKIDMGRPGRPLGVPRWAKRLSQRGSQNGVEKVIENGTRNERFLDAKNLQKYCKVLQNRGSEGRDQHTSAYKST